MKSALFITVRPLLAFQLVLAIVRAIGLATTSASSLAKVKRVSSSFTRAGRSDGGNIVLITGSESAIIPAGIELTPDSNVPNASRHSAAVGALGVSRDISPIRTATSVTALPLRLALAP